MSLSPAAEILESALGFYADTSGEVLDKLKSLTRIPSVSFPGYPPEEVERSAQKVVDLMKESGLENVEILRVPRAHPYVYGDWLHAGDAPTVLLYAHHDVQPPMREELWNSPPFEPTEKNGRLFARGISDDKAGVMVHLASVASYLQTTGKCPVNIKIIVEGEEETGSEHLAEFCRAFQQKLDSDCLVLADVANYDTGIPSLTTSLRGLVCLDVTVSSLKAPLHSGMWGGPIPDPIIALSKMISGLVNDNGEITLPELVADVLPPSQGELEDLKKLNMSRTLFARQSGTLNPESLLGEDEELLLKIWKKPSLVINAIQAGGKKIAGNVLMDSAWARVGLRTVPGMDAEKCLGILKNYFASACPWPLKVEIAADTAVNAWSTETSHPVFSLMKIAMEQGYGHPTVFIGCGGTIPFVEPITAVMGDIPALLVGVEDPYTNAHSENESLDIQDFHKAVRSQIHFFTLLSENPGVFK